MFDLRMSKTHIRIAKAWIFLVESHTGQTRLPGDVLCPM
jgi:hypothetical protein